MNDQVLERLDREFASGMHGRVDSILVIRHGAIVWERDYPQDYEVLFLASPGASQARGPYNYYDPEWHPFHSGSSLHSLQSVTKSVTSALVGIAILRGEVAGTETALGTYLGSEGQVPSGLLLRHLLTMTSGISWNEDVPYTDPANDWAAMEQSKNWLAYVLSRPLSDEPGSKFCYNSGNSILLAQALRTATGQQPDEYARQYLFAPLGIKNSFWKHSPDGLPDTQGGLYLTPRDLAKIGYLYLRDGVWEDRRILPEGWVAQTVFPAADADGWKYGYHWWLLPYEKDGAPRLAWTCLGYGGQRMFILPEENLIAVFTGWNVYGEASLPADEAIQRLLLALLGLG